MAVIDTDRSAPPLTAQLASGSPTHRFNLQPASASVLQRAIKRGFDIIVAGTLLTAAAPLMLVAAIAVRLDSPGPVLFKQVRLGQFRRPFGLYKFRTMVENADCLLADVLHLNEADGPLFKASNDPRLTRVGRLLRRTYLDEVPQLINVLLGEMSMVGPRPCLAREFEADPTSFGCRFDVPQGITGPWQVSGHHGITFADQMEIERTYIEKCSLRADLSILLRTIPLVLGQTGH